MSILKLDTLEKIEARMETFDSAFSDPNARVVTPQMVSFLAEAILTITREVRQLRDGGFTK